MWSGAADSPIKPSPRSPPREALHEQSYTRCLLRAVLHEEPRAKLPWRQFQGTPGQVCSIWPPSSCLITTLAMLDRDPNLICGRTSVGRQHGRNKQEHVWTSTEVLATLLVTPGTRSPGVLQAESVLTKLPSSWITVNFAKLERERPVYDPASMPVSTPRRVSKICILPPMCKMRRGETHQLNWDQVPDTPTPGSN